MVLVLNAHGGRGDSEMRMWMVKPELMCRKHLLGEHVEIHMMVGSLRRGRSIAGHLERGQLEPRAAQVRHHALAVEMQSRGYQHVSPLPGHGRLTTKQQTAKVDAAWSLAELRRRCAECARRNKP